jgi:uncharacterized protein (TIGR02246 family)
MTETAPPVVERYFRATDAADAAALAECFTTDGVVEDDGETLRGRDEILAWRAALASRFTYTTTVTGSRAVDADSYRVEVTIEGDFPGGKADLAFLFTLRDDLIAALVIGG